MLPLENRCHYHPLILQARMRTPRSLPGFSGVLNTGMVTVACLYIAMGFYGFLKFGPSVKAVS